MFFKKIFKKGKKKEEENSKSSPQLLPDKIPSKQCVKIEKMGSENMVTGFKYDYSMKIVVTGYSEAGKSRLIMRYADDYYTDEYVSTIGVDFKTNIVELSNGKVAKLLIWDKIYERFSSGRKTCSYFQSNGIIFCYDQTKPEPSDIINGMALEIKRYAPKDVFVMVVRTKSDLPSCPENPDGARKLADALGAPLVECSAKTGAGVDEVFKKLFIGISRKTESERIDFYIEKEDEDAPIVKI